MEFGLFGTFSVWRDGRRLTDREIGARKARTLLKLLVVERGRPVTIDRAVDVLWGDAPPERAEENVATVVSRLRAALGADVVAGGRGGYQLTPTAAVDVDRVVSLLDEADARLVCGAVRLHRFPVQVRCRRARRTLRFSFVMAMNNGPVMLAWMDRLEYRSCGSMVWAVQSPAAKRRQM